MDCKKSDLLTRLLGINVFKLGDFLLKSGTKSPIYIDLRSIISHPDVVKCVAELINSSLTKEMSVDVVCGVPYTALPIASVYSVIYNVPMVMKRKEAKNYGTKKMVEGIIEKNVHCLIIEDIVTSGSSVIEVAEVLRQEGLIVNDCVVVLDRMQGGRENLSKAGITLHSLFTIGDLFQKYCSLNNVEESVIQDVENYLKDNVITVRKPMQIQLPFNERSENCSQPLAKKLLRIMADKETNLCLSADVEESTRLLMLANVLGPYICILKTHIDIVKEFSPAILLELKSVAKKFNFLIMEDRKFADIGSTVVKQYCGGMYNIVQWADIITVHGIAGSHALAALKHASDKADCHFFDELKADEVSGFTTEDDKRGCVLIAEMSSKGTLTDEDYQKKIVEMAENHPDFVVGFVSQSKVTCNQNFLQLSPGISISASEDSLGQQYKSPAQAVFNGADILIVGRGITQAEDIVQAALHYKNEGYKAYLEKCNKA